MVGDVGGNVRHRTARPVPARHRTEPDLAGDRLPRTRPPRLDARARPDRRNPPLGTQTPSPAPVLRRRPTPHHRWNPAPTRRDNLNDRGQMPTATGETLTIQVKRVANLHKRLDM